jgi:hypothetical protein
MAKSALGLHAVHMRRLGPNPDRSLASSAHELQQAAGTLQSHAARADAVPTYGITLAYVEEAVDRLAVSLDQMVNAVADARASRRDGPAHRGGRVLRELRLDAAAPRSRPRR